MVLHHLQLMNVLYCIDDFISPSECDELSKFILESEDWVKSVGSDTYEGTSEDSLTGRWVHFNYLYYQPGRILVPKLKELFGDCVAQCWANTFRKGEGITDHEHGLGFYTCNLFLDGDPLIGTNYDGVLLESKRGTLIINDSMLTHHVRPNPTDQVRISMALDVFVDTHGKIHPHPNLLHEDNPNRFYKIGSPERHNESFHHKLYPGTRKEKGVHRHDEERRI